MMQLTNKDLEVVSHLMIGEQMACKKAKMYANTLTDIDLSAKMGELAQRHQERFSHFLTILNGGKM